jgi:hypothetical protein
MKKKGEKGITTHGPPSRCPVWLPLLRTAQWPVGSLPLTPWLSCFGTDGRAPASAKHTTGHEIAVSSMWGPRARSLSLPRPPKQNRTNPVGLLGLPFCRCADSSPLGYKEIRAPCPLLTRTEPRTQDISLPL